MKNVLDEIMSELYADVEFRKRYPSKEEWARTHNEWDLTWEENRALCNFYTVEDFGTGWVRFEFYEGDKENGALMVRKADQMSYEMYYSSHYYYYKEAEKKPAPYKKGYNKMVEEADKIAGEEYSKGEGDEADERAFSRMKSAADKLEAESNDADYIAGVRDALADLME